LIIDNKRIDIKKKLLLEERKEEMREIKEREKKRGREFIQ